MRILSLGFPLPGARVDNFTFITAPSFFDYDALIVDPQALSRLIAEVVGGGANELRSGECIVNGPEQPGALSFAELLRDRRDETARLLERGGIVVCFAYPNVVHQGIAGWPDCDRYCWLPAPEGLRYAEPFLRRGEGRRVQPSAESHEFVPFLTQFSGRLAYHVYFEEDSLSGDQVLARSTGEAVVAVELTVGRGRVIFLPPPARALAGDELYELSNALQEAIRQTLRAPSASGAPGWLTDYPLPGEGKGGEADRGLTETETTISKPPCQVDPELFRRLLWQQGRYGLEDAVRRALALLGFAVHAGDLEEPATISFADDRRGQRAALLEVDASEEAVGLAGHCRLRQRIEDAISRGKPAAGVLFVNGYRRTPPPERPAQYTDALRVVAERFRYCVATTEQLFHAVRAALEGDEATVRAFRERLLTTEGGLHQD